MAAMPPVAKPAPPIRSRPMRSASRSMSREKLSWPCAIMAWLPTTTAWAVSMLREWLAASKPRMVAAIVAMPWWLALVMLRAMWRCVTCVISWASTEASSSGVAVMPTSPRYTPT